MKKFLSLGNWNNNYKYIISSSIFLTIYKIIVGYNYYSYKMDWIADDKEISSHVFIQQFLYYFLIFIAATVFNIHEQNKEKKEILDKNNRMSKLIEKDKNNEILSINSQDLIYNNIYEYEYQYKKISNFFSYIIIFLYVIEEQASIVFKRYFVNCDFWMLELIIMAVLNKKMYKIDIYRHQILSIFLVLIPVILKVATIVLLFYDDKNQKYSNNEEKKEYEKKGINYKYPGTDNDLKMLFVVHYHLLAVAILIYLVIITLKAYVTISIKRIMDLKYVSLSKVLIFYGGIGACLLFIFSLVASFFSCGNLSDRDFYDISYYQCQVIDDGNNDTYVEQIKFLITQGTIWKNILIPFVGGVAFGFYKLFVMLIVKYLTPIHKSFSLPIYYFLQKIVLIYKVIRNEHNIIEYNNYIYWIDLSSDVAAVIAFLIYLEIIELNFFGFNDNLRKNIINRCREDFKQYNIAASENEIESEESSSSVSKSLSELETSK